MDPLILNVGTRKGGVANLTPCHLTPRIEPWYPLIRKLSGPQIRQVRAFWRRDRILPTADIRTTDHPARSLVQPIPTRPTLSRLFTYTIYIYIYI